VTGRKLSHYDILDDLGAGGMGVVYRAHDTRLDRDVAIKVLPTDRPLSDTARQRFQREALAASALNHPNIITIYEVGSEDGTDFIVMEYVRGATLSSLLKKRPLGLTEATRYCVQIAEALAKAHASGIVHRDLKPGNIMITEDGLVKVLDFGLAKFDVSATTKDRESADNDTAAKEFTLTQPGMITGTVAYMSPEQARGERVDARSDIFSFGIVMFEALSRHLPFPGPNSIALLHNLHFSPPRDLGELAP
jgi:serine/threonine protein kinase